MPKVNWGVSRDVIDDFDRESGFKPYAGKVPPNAVYKFRVKVLKFAARTREKNPSLQAGLELVPRDADERPFEGYFITKFMAVAETNSFQWVPFLDAIGVSANEFLKGTITDEQGNVRKIGNWRMDGKTEILGQLVDGTDQNGNTRKEIKWVGAVEDTDTEEEEEEEGYDDEGF
jgi:hypothetical protein